MNRRGIRRLRSGIPRWLLAPSHETSGHSRFVARFPLCAAITHRLLPSQRSQTSFLGPVQQTPYYPPYALLGFHFCHSAPLTMFC